jgi:signal transduction histidine kinase/CheY-like chemotaxis protein/HAMP domain-containing protein/HPt (histidine-containing phosphotransfer) domain-containing protein
MEKSNNPVGVKRSLPLKIAVFCALLAAAILILSILNLHSTVSVAILAVVILILAVLITAAVCRIVVLRRIRAVIDMLKSLRDGDLTQKLTIQSDDEIGEMASHINFTVEKVKSMVASLEQRGRLLDTANTAAAILLANNDMDAFESSLLKCFELIGQRMDADRIQIWRNEIIENEPHFVLRYQWLSDYEKDCESIPLGLHFPYSMKEEWHRKFSNHEYINAPVRELPAEDQAFLMPYNLKSLVIIPMFLEGDFWGFFSIDDCHSERTFSNEEINILTSTGLMMSSAVNRNIQALTAREAEERTQIMFDSAPFGMTFWDEGLNIIDCNNEVVRLFDLSDKQEFIERFYEFSPEYQPDGSLSKEKAPEIIKRAMDEGYYRYEWTHIKKNGELILMEVIFVRVRYKGKYSLIAYMRDLREQKAMIAANAKMRKTDEFAQVMFRAMPLTCHLWNMELQCIMCNDEAMRVYRVTDRKYFLKNFFDFSPEYQPDGRLSKEKGYEFLKRGFEEGYMRFEWIHKRGDGEDFPCEITIIRAMYGGEPALLTYTRDLSEEIAVIKEREKAEIAEEGSKAKSDFLARMSHEIRTPMNAILGITEIQLQDDSHPPLTKEAFERIYNSGNLLLGIINDILDLSKIEAGKLEFSPDQYDIASLIHDTVQINIMRYETKPIEFILNVKEDLPLLLIGDELRIKQILNNILSNAFKYTDKGSVKLTVYSEPDVQNDSKINLVFIINDTGQGMTPEQIQKLGTEYSRFNLQANRKTEGTGLGMNITRNLIQLMNGTISIESASGKGSTFTVRLPQDCAGSTAIGKEIADNLMGLRVDNSVKLRAFQMKKEYMPYGRVLVVDDVETNLYVAKGLMAPYGLSLETAMSGFEAIDKIKAGLTYDIIFMDHMMPGMDGIEAAKIIRDLGYSKPIVALTANAISGQAAMFMENGFDDFISKPIDIRQLNITLNKLIRDKYPADVVEAAKRQRKHLYSGGVQGKAPEPQLAEAFIRDAKKAIAKLEEVYLEKCRSEEELSTFIIEIHAMKSALANIGETEISAEALKLEKAGREKNTALILSELPSFMEMLRDVIKKFESRENDEKKDNDPGDNKSLKEKLLIVKEACASYDKKTAKDTLVEIKRKKWPRHVNEQILSLSTHLLHSDFDEAAQAIDGYIKQL